MGCHTDGSPCGNYGFAFTNVTTGRNNVNHCDARVPSSDGPATVTFGMYPYLNWGLKEQEDPAVMYDSILYSPYPPQTSRYDYTSPQGGTEYAGANCGKLVSSIGCGTVFFENHPSELSFKIIPSDTWFYYLYDMGTNGGAVGTPCYRIQTETRSGSTTTSTTSGGTTTPGGTTNDQGGSTQKCIPCTSFYCTPTSSYCSYTYAGPDETGDPDCPYPLIYGIGTDSNKVVVQYDALSTTLPDGAEDFNFVYSADGIDTDCWNETNFTSGGPVVTSQNSWEASENNFTDFFIETLEFGTAVGLTVKVRIGPALQQAADPDDAPVAYGTQWELMEVISQGQNYSVNDTFTLEYDHDHPSGASTTFTIDLKITSVGTVSAVQGVTDFSLLNTGDTLNGHLVTNTAHQDVDNMPYHVIYLDGNGNDFVKDTQYVSDRNHTVTAVAGYGIADRAFFGGLYEFPNKSIQYTVHTVDQDAIYDYPGYDDATVQPEVTVTVQNGRVTGASVTDGGANWDTIGEKPVLAINPPIIASGKSAKIEGTFSGGALTSVKIVDGGSGYNDLDPPSIFVFNYYKSNEETITGTGTSAEDMGISNMKELSESEFLKDIPNPFDTIEQNAATQSQSIAKAGREAKFDKKRNRKETLPRTKYTKGAVDNVRDLQEVPSLKQPEGVSVLPQSWDDNLDYTKKVQEDNIDAQLSALEDNVNDRTFSGPEIYVETTQRRFGDMPYASRYTKYMMKQYRPDGDSEVTLNITVGCNVLEDGCGHLEEVPNPLDGGAALCPSPLGFPTPNSSTTTSETSDPDPVTGDTTTTDTTISYTYTLSGMLGSGCKSWSASGSKKIKHSYTDSRNSAIAATDAYGNPFDT